MTKQHQIFVKILPNNECSDHPAKSSSHFMKCISMIIIKTAGRSQFLFYYNKKRLVKNCIRNTSKVVMFKYTTACMIQQTMDISVVHFLYIQYEICASIHQLHYRNHQCVINSKISQRFQYAILVAMKDQEHIDENNSLNKYIQ